MSSDVNYITYFGPDVNAAYSGRDFPNKSHKKFLKEIDIAAGSLVTVKQVHGKSVVSIHGKGKSVSSPNAFIGDPLDSRLRGNDNTGVEADALITNQSGIALGIKTADCVPIFLFDPETKVVGLIHAGWKGLKAGIVGQTIKKMAAEYSVQASQVKAVLGPAIRPCCYEVGKDFLKNFDKKYFKGNKCNLLFIAATQLMDAGVNMANIQDLEVCTSCRNDEFFSYRKEKTDERMLSVIQPCP